MSNSQSTWQPTLSEQEKEIVFRTTGMTCDEIRDMDIDEIHARIEKKIGKKLTFKPKKKMRLLVAFRFYLITVRFLWIRISSTSLLIR